eukprot:CAMPEP_0172567332 /NCGR_PEP_ID=MMETSP1067-20121228/115522_1 /TAXON_ID=265564 ORGANISM="Thalassiosira punctigera, Strain Tpunct2005C2" /NCGR_SAMPLE_ID=MMETSP1067 /ASSEMBLY_ACC=CAM_ASM_000444 /LENGTH=96 /DNA_ID=CAMNT_0013358669 /DNA_START=17 /DNA_END=303 /DNA_ORIENTATION=-
MTPRRPPQGVAAASKTPHGAAKASADAVGAANMVPAGGESPLQPRALQKRAPPPRVITSPDSPSKSPKKKKAQRARRGTELAFDLVVFGGADSDRA